MDLATYGKINMYKLKMFPYKVLHSEWEISVYKNGEIQ